MLNITDNLKEQRITPILRLGFRPFFLFGGMFAIISIALWVLMLRGILIITPVNGSMWWHSHEMLFGFAPAIIAGFLLTAVQTWTSIPSIKGKTLFGLLFIWLLARVLLLINPDNGLILVMLIDVSFLPLVAYCVGSRIVKVRQYRNLIFIPVLLLMSIANAVSYSPIFDLDASYAQRSFYGMTLLITFLVAFLGGRVIPMFTANGTQTPKVLPIKWLELASLTSLFLVFVGLVFSSSIDQTILGIICYLSAGLHFFRKLSWRPWVTFQVPLVWSLHFTMLFLPIGLVLLGIHFTFQNITLSAALHSLTVGVIGGMILAMMSRVSLGHTGRMLQVNTLVQLSFLAIIICAIVRSILVAIWPQYISQLWAISALLWCTAFTCFVWVYLPILSSARVDGRPG